MDGTDLAHAALKASGVVKKGIGLKFGAIGAAVFCLVLILLGSFMPAPDAAAASCQDSGPGTDNATPVNSSSRGQSTGSIRQQQITNAKTIDQVAQKLGLPGRATLIALMTALQESGLQNLNYGDLDSRGLFQQRPSADWGTVEQIMTPTFAAESFFKGRGTNRGLMQIPNWQTRPMGEVAQAVQISKFPTLYSGHESEARGIAKEAGIDLGRKGTASTTSTADPATSGTTGKCPATPTGNTKNGSGKFTDGRQTWALHNPRTVEQAIAWAKAHAGINSTGDWYARCLAFTAIVYGWNFSGVTYAIDHYTVVPKEMRHDGDRHPPPGALMYWDTGHRAGHIAVYLGGGKVASNDILRNGYIDVVDADLIESKWGAKYVGWTPPVFPNGG